MPEETEGFSFFLYWWLKNKSTLCAAVHHQFRARFTGQNLGEYGTTVSRQVWCEPGCWKVTRVQALCRRIHMRRALLLVVSISFAAYAQKAPAQAVVKVQKASLTRDQELQLGKEAASAVEREMEVVQNPEIEGWLNQIGQRLAKTPEANAYPYYFKLVNEPSINAFALPGGPMYVHTGLLQAADTEGEVVGVLAHEMSHVALRHGAAQMGKQQTWGTVFGLAGTALGAVTTAKGQCGMLCQLGQTGLGIGGTSVLMKFSRGFERDADLNGARMMASPSFF